jgi:hypothetical protein
MSAFLNNKKPCAIYIDNIHGRCSLVEDVSLSEQETYAMLRVFMDAAVGCVLDVSLSKQKICAIYIFR